LDSESMLARLRASYACQREPAYEEQAQACGKV
jgi:hypothetical protein